MPKEIIFFISAIAIFFSSNILSYLLCRLIISFEKKKKISATIHRLVVSTHQEKKNTPSIGGIGIILSILLTTLIFDFSFFQSKTGLVLSFVIIAFFSIGLYDDVIKVVKKNEYGLPASLRILLEVATSLLALVLLGFEQKTKWLIALPLNLGYVYLGFFFLVLYVFIIIGTANSSNLTDGLDGLNSGVLMIALAPFIIYALKINEFELAFFLLSVVGALLGFLILNLHPAKIFMGDAGSLPLGAILGFIAIYLGRVGELGIVGLIYVVEALSVIIQVLYFKWKRKRVFLMAPLHHHFELKGYPEMKVVLSYYVFAFALSIIGFLMG